MEEIRLVNNVEGSIVSDAMLNKVDVIQKQAEEIGILKGELKYTNEYLDLEANEHARQLKEVKTKVIVEFGRTVDVNKSRNTIRNDWGDIVYMTQHEPETINRITVDKVQLEELANAAAIGEAKKKEDAANKTLKSAEKLEQWAKDTEKGAGKLVDDMRKSQKDATEKAVEYAEKKNVKEIKNLELDIKSLMTEADLLVDERSNIAKERDLAFETMDTQLRLYKNRIDILERPAKTVMTAINNRLHNWYFNRKINRLNS